MVYDPALTTSSAGPKRQTKTLVEHCKDTLSTFLEGFGSKAGHPVEYACIIDGGYRRLMISIYDEEDEFPHAAANMAHVETLDAEGKGPRYAILGTMREGEMTWLCGEEELKSFFSKDGRRILRGEEVSVQDRVRMRWERERVVARKAVRKGRRGYEGNEDDAGGLDEVQQEDDDEQGAMAAAAAQRKRERRKAKKDRQKVHRREQASLMKQAHEECIHEAVAQLGGMSGVVVDPSTAEGQAKLKELKDRGGQVHSIYSRHQLPQ